MRFMNLNEMKNSKIFFLFQHQRTDNLKLHHLSKLKFS